MFLSEELKKLPYFLRQVLTVRNPFVMNKNDVIKEADRNVAIYAKDSTTKQFRIFFSSLCH